MDKIRGQHLDLHVLFVKLMNLIFTNEIWKQRCIVGMKLSLFQYLYP